jgi:hypothetical protein
MAVGRLAAENCFASHRASEGSTMNGNENRHRAPRDEKWITQQQFLTCACWSALLLFAAFYEIVEPLLA